MKIRGDQDNLRMLVANNNGTKEILWHGPEKIQGQTFQTNQLKIIGIADIGADCQPCLVPYLSEQVGIISEHTPAVILYEPKNVYQRGTSSTHDLKQQIYDNGTLKDDYWKINNSATIKWIGFQFIGNNQEIHYRQLNKNDEFISGAVEHESFINFTKTGNTYNYSVNTKTGKLYNNIVALIKVKSGSKYYPWHFHIGMRKEGLKQNAKNEGFYLRFDANDGYNIHRPSTDTPAFIWEENCTSYETAKATILDKDTWYELYIEPTNLQGVYENFTDSYTNYKSWNFFRVRKASADHIKWWCSQEEGQAEGTISYTTDSITYDFNIKKEDESVIASKSFSLTNLAQETVVDSDNESYSTPLETNINNYLYTPIIPLALAIDKYSVEPRLFTNNHPVNVVYYSNCKFCEVPAKVYGETLVGQAGLSIEGLLTQKESFSDICMASFSSNASLYAECTADKPAIIKYEPKYKYAVNTAAASNPNSPIKMSSYTYTDNGRLVEGNLYKADLNGVKPNSNKFSSITIYDEEGNQLINNTDLQWRIGIGCGFLIKGDDEEITVSEITQQSIYHLDSDKYDIPDTNMAGGLFKWTGQGTFEFYTKESTTRPGKHLPKGNVIALIQIGSNPDPFFKKGYKLIDSNNAVIGNNYWHFHVGGQSLTLSTYKAAFPMKYSINSAWSALSQDTTNGWKDQEIIHTGNSLKDSLEFIPVEDKWYALYLNESANFYETQRNKIDLIKIREATEEELNEWLTDEDLAIRTNGDVIVENESIKCDFSISIKENDEITTSDCTLTLPQAQKDIRVFDEYYFNDTQNLNDSCYYRISNKNYILEIEKNNPSPIIFNENNPINKVKYSGCSFIPLSTATFSMPDYVGSNSLNIIGITNTSTQENTLGQGVVSKGNNFVRYMDIDDSEELPIIIWDPKDIYKMENVQSSTNYDIVKGNYGYTKQASNTSLDMTSQCFELGGHNSTASGKSGYHWGTYKDSAITDGTRKLNSPKLHGPDNGRFIGYFKFGDFNDQLFCQKDNGVWKAKGPSTSTYGYFIHWHAYFNVENDFGGDGAANKGIIGGMQLPILHPDPEDQTIEVDPLVYTNGSINPNTPVWGVIKQYTKEGNTYTYTDSTNYDMKGGYKIFRPVKNRWYGLIIDPKWTSDQYLSSTFTGEGNDDASRNKYIFLCEITNDNGEIKEEHRKYLNSNKCIRFCQKSGTNLLFTVYVNNEKKDFSIPYDVAQSYFNININNNTCELIDKNALIANYPSCLFSNDSDLCIEIERNSSQKQVFNAQNPICIPEMSGCRFVNVN